MHKCKDGGHAIFLKKYVNTEMCNYSKITERISVRSANTVGYKFGSSLRRKKCFEHCPDGYGERPKVDHRC